MSMAIRQKKQVEKSLSSVDGIEQELSFIGANKLIESHHLSMVKILVQLCYVAMEDCQEWDYLED